MEDFFKTQTASSRIKASIVAEYFPKYSRILLKKPQNSIRYLDLFAGPGLYEDGSYSTPMLIGKSCAEDINLAQKVHLIFNDNKYSNELKQNFERDFPPGTFAYAPRFGDRTVGEDMQIENYLKKTTDSLNPNPTLLFFDPWGYKGIDTLVLSKFLENWGNEIFLFVNIKRIHAAIENDKFEDLMQTLFPTSFNKLKVDRRYVATVHERLNLIMEHLADEFCKASKDRLYHCSFKFQEEDSNATSHFIIHFTKHAKGYELVKQIYYDFDNIGATLESDGNYSFDAKRMGNVNQLDFGDENVLALAENLTQSYKGREVKAGELFKEHHVKTKYCGTHYVKTLRFMEKRGDIKVEFTDGKTHLVKVLVNNNCIIKFN